MRSILVIGELALTVVLLIGAGLMVRSFLKLYTLDLGIDSDHLLTMRADLPSKKYETPDQRRQAFDAILSKISAVPGVRAAAIADTIPMGGAGRRDVELEGKPKTEGTAAPQAIVISVTPNYFKTVDATLRRGREFDANDGAAGAESIIVNERFVARFLPGEDPIGRRVKLTIRGNTTATTPEPWRTIVGVSPTIRQGDPQALEPDAVVYQPYRQRPGTGMAILVRTDGNPTALTPQIRQAVQAADADQAVFNVQSLNDVLANVRWPFRVFGSMFAIFALVALALSAVGIYAVTSYTVTQRTAEIGVRMALGAQPVQVWWLILRQGLFQLVIGLALGLAAGWPLSSVLKTLVVQIPSRDPVTFTLTAALLALVMLAACLVPARRATRLDPLAALRVD